MAANVLAARISNIYRQASLGRIFFLIFGVGLILRVIVPTLKILHHDEAIHAWFTYELITKGTYLYDPMYHGPLLYYLTGFFFSIFGDSDLIVRILPGIFGAAIIPLIYGFYKTGWIERNHAIWTALFFAFSPDMVYFSRFLRHDIFQLFFTVLLLLAIFAYLHFGKWRYALIAGIAGACGLCLKEDMPFTLFIFGSFFIIMLCMGRIRLPQTWIRDLGTAIGISAIIGFIFYSSLFNHPEMFFNAPFKAIEHWTSMHDQCRLCGPPYWYILILSLYEVPIIALAIYGVYQWGFREKSFSKVINTIQNWFASVRKEHRIIQEFRETDYPSTLMLLALWWVILSMAFYGYIGEKVPWLVIHQLFPLIILASYKITGWKTLAGFITCAYLIVMTVHVCFIPVDINEPIVQVQNSEDLHDLMHLIDLSDRVVVASESYWPLPWYYRGEKWDKISFYGGKVEPSAFINKNPDMVILHDTSSYDQLSGYEKVRYRLSYWFSWYDNQDRIPEWYLFRDGKTGSVNLDVFVRPELLKLNQIN